MGEVSTAEAGEIAAKAIAELARGLGSQEAIQIFVEFAAAGAVALEAETNDWLMLCQLCLLSARKTKAEAEKPKGSVH